MPLTGYLAMAIEAARQRALLRGVNVTDASTYRFRQIAVRRSLIIPETSDVEVSVTFKPVSEGIPSSSDVWDDFRIFSLVEDNGCVEHCRGLVSFDPGDKELNAVNGQSNMNGHDLYYQQLMKEAKDSRGVSVDVSRAYETLSKAGIEFGPLFQNLQEAQASSGQCIGVIGVPNTISAMPFDFERNTWYIQRPWMLVYIRYSWQSVAECLIRQHCTSRLS